MANKITEFQSPLFRLLNLPSTPPPPSDEQFYAALGRFIASYAAVEVVIHQLARKLSNLKDDKARVLFGGMRLGDVTSRTRALLKLSNRSQKIKEDIESCFAQFDIIGLERDRMVHRDSSFHAGELTVSNHETAKSVVHSEWHSFSTVDLLNMHIDCLTIYLRLTQIRLPRLKNRKPARERRTLYEPWRYKPVPPKTQASLKTLKIAEALLNPPRASQP